MRGLTDPKADDREAIVGHSDVAAEVTDIRFYLIGARSILQTDIKFTQPTLCSHVHL